MKLKISVTISSPLHIGGETRQNTDATRPLLKRQTGRRKGLPYIPATSIKGRLRAEVERLVRSTPRVYVCDAPAPDQMCRAEPCSVCALFGSPWHESRLYFRDLDLDEDYLKLLEVPSGTANASQQPSEPVLAVPLTQARPGVRINRQRRTAEDDFLFETELYEPGLALTFVGEVEYMGSNPLDLTPLYLAAHGVTMIGGGRSRGLGWCRVDIEGCPSQVELAAQWERWVSQRQKPEQTA